MRHIVSLLIALPLLCTILCGVLLLSPTTILADTEVQNPVLTSEGTGGEKDRSRRGPVLSVGTVQSSDNVKILVDAYVPNTKYARYPLKFDFFINRMFITSQIRSPELTGAIGIDVPSHLVQPPYSYSVIATVLHPNRTFTTLVSGEITTSAPVSTLTCTIITNKGTDNEASFEKSNISLIQASPTNVTLEITDATDESAENTLSFTGSVSIDSENKVTGSGTLKGSNTDASDLTFTGSAEKSENVITSLELSDTGETTTISCAKSS